MSHNINYNRNGNIELIRFLAAILIMLCHLSLDFFQTSWIYVEVFLIITGYYTARHFTTHTNIPSQTESCITYTIQKFLPLFPYTLIATTLMYLITYIPGLVSKEYNVIGLFWTVFQDYFFDILFLIEIYQKPLLGTLWYLSAIFIIFPLFILLVQFKNKHTLLIVTFLYPLLYYGRMSVVCDTEYPYAFFRVFAGMCIGASIFYCIFLFENYIKRINVRLLTAIELITFFIPCAATYNNYIPSRFMLFCFCISLSIALSGLSYTSKICGKLPIYLGKLSVPIYIYHLFFITLFNVYDIGDKLLCCIVTIISSMIMLWFVEHYFLHILQNILPRR